MVLAVIVSFAASLVSTIHAKVGEEKVPVKMVAVLLTITGIFTMIALSVYTSLANDYYKPLRTTQYINVDKGFSWTYAFGWIATVGAFIGAGLVFFLKSNTGESDSKRTEN